MTVQFCERFNKPVLVLDGSKLKAETAALQAAAFVESHAIRTLNVAGPRESGHPGARAYAEHVIHLLVGGADSATANRPADAPRGEN